MAKSIFPSLIAVRTSALRSKVARWALLFVAASALRAGTATDGPRVRTPSIVVSALRAASIVACIAAGSEILPVRTLPWFGSARPRPVKNPLQRRVRAWLPTSWLKQTGFLTPAALNRSPAPRPAWNSVCPTWALIPRSRKTYEAGRLLGHGGIDELRHLDHVALGVRCAVVDADAHVRGAGLDAIAHDAPEAVDRLAVGHDLDLDVLLLDERAVEGASRCRATPRWRRRITRSEHDHRAHEQDRGLSKVHPVSLLTYRSRACASDERPDRPRRLVARFPW